MRNKSIHMTPPECIHQFMYISRLVRVLFLSISDFFSECNQFNGVVYSLETRWRSDRSKSKSVRPSSPGNMIPHRGRGRKVCTAPRRSTSGLALNAGGGCKSMSDIKFTTNDLHTATRFVLPIFDFVMLDVHRFDFDAQYTHDGDEQAEIDLKHIHQSFVRHFFKLNCI